MSEQQKVNKYNSEVRAWFRGILSKLKDEFAKQNIQHVSYSPSPGASVDKLEQRTKSKQGIVNRGSIKFPKHMVYVHKGVGKGVPASIAGSSAAGKRKPKDWFNSVITANIDELADIAAENSADIMTEKLLIK